MNRNATIVVKGKGVRQQYVFQCPDCGHHLLVRHLNIGVMVTKLSSLHATDRHKDVERETCVDGGEPHPNREWHMEYRCANEDCNFEIYYPPSNYIEKYGSIPNHGDWQEEDRNLRKILIDLLDKAGALLPRTSWKVA